MSSSDEITPPASFAGPPSPPATDPRKQQLPREARDLLETIERWEKGIQLAEGEQTFHLPESAFDKLQDYLGDRSLENHDKLKYRYFSERETFTLRMPVPFHDCLIGNIVDDIKAQLDTIKAYGNPSSREFASKIKTSELSGTVYIEDKENGIPNHQPDGQLRHAEAAQPGVILEVAYSQNKKDLADLADDYILGGEEDIRVVVGLKVGYGNDKEASLSVWRCGWDERDQLRAVKTTDDKIIRDEHGNYRSGDGFSIELEEFATKDLSQTQSIKGKVSISLDSLAEHIKQAEDADKLKRGSGVRSVNKKMKGKRKRTPTPEPATLTEQIKDDEEWLVDELVTEERKAKLADRSYRPRRRSSLC